MQKSGWNSPAEHLSIPLRQTGKATVENFGIPRWKRVFDLACIAISFPLWLPLMALLAAGIKIVAPGPLLFRQERVGYRGKHFVCFKFRSMRINAETRIHEAHLERLIQSDRPMTKLDSSGDPRLIPFGRIMRASGLDEIAQIFNVIRGEMSLVGPRPCTPHEFQKYQPEQKERVNVLPGITGYWQVNGKNKTTFREMIAMDLFYAKNMSLWLDLQIVLKTVPVLLIQSLESRIAASFESGTKKTVAEQNP